MTPAAALLVFSLLAATPDPRIQLVEHRVAQSPDEALAWAEALKAADPEAAAALGLDYVRGRLLEELERPDAARAAFADTLTSTPALAPWARLRLAQEQEEQDHPEVAAGLIAGLVAARPPDALLGQAVALLERVIVAGGDCRLLTSLRRVPKERDARRRFALADAVCAGRGGEPAQRRRILLDLLEGDTEDDIALQAAVRLTAQIPPGSIDSAAELEEQILLGYAFFHHREFERAIRYLGSVIVRLPSDVGAGVSTREAFELRYALARSQFWLERFEPAAAAFGALAGSTSDTTQRARALYQRARSLELAGTERWDDAIEAFRETYAVQPTGRWSSASLIATLRLLWRSGREDDALAVLDTLRARRRASETARSLLFLAASDLAQGRADRADTWLVQAARFNRLTARDIEYWRARSAEVVGDVETAITRYVGVLRADPYHPYAVDAAARLRAESALGDVARRRGRALVGSDRFDQVEAAWLLLGADDPLGRRALARLRLSLRADPRARPMLELEPVPVAEWPLWRGSLARPEEKLLALGLFAEGGSQVLRHFPVATPPLAFTGSRELARAGATKRSLYVAEVLAKRVPSRVPYDALPVDYRRLLYPFRYSYWVLRESSKREIDPFLLAGLIREESRYDPEAFSGASARGLAQFIVPTARRVADAIDLELRGVRSLHDPETAIALGAGYLGLLAVEHEGRIEEMAAGYNAGEPQARLWRNYCFSDEMPEYLAKIAFRETRGYVAKVLTSRAHYAALYGASEARVDDAPLP
ncbi:MAG: transglycosylase SLT domain-containing protein [Acidobacteriota bacterium]